MSNRFDEALRKVAEETFETLAFILPVPEEDGAEAACLPQVAASVAFTGPFGGSIALAVSAEMLPALGANMLGLDDGDEPPLDKQLDALGELLNIICGNLLPVIGGSEAVFDVHAPEILPDGPAPHERTPAATAHLSLTDGQAELALFLGKPQEGDRPLSEGACPPPNAQGERR